MNDAELLNQTEHVADIFTRIMSKIMGDDVTGSLWDGITLAQLQALRYVSQHGPCTIGSLACGLDISQPAATMLVDRMAKRELVDRQPGKTDRRQAEITLTDHARDLLHRFEDERLERLARILGFMESDERHQFVESLERFISAALRLESLAGEVCLKCGRAHHAGCIVSQNLPDQGSTGISKSRPA